MQCTPMCLHAAQQLMFECSTWMALLFLDQALSKESGHRASFTPVSLGKCLMFPVAQEPDMEVLASMLEAVEEIIDIAAPALLPPGQLAACTERLRAVLAASGERRAERQARRQAEDFDAEEAEALAVRYLSSKISMDS